MQIRAKKMNNTMEGITLFLFLILLLKIQCGSCISCYTCSSWNGSNVYCHDPFNAAMSEYTDGCTVPKVGHVGRFPAHFCIKVIGNSVENNVELVIRVCTLETMDNQCGVFKFQKVVYQGCILTCDYDGCNVSIAPAASVFFVFVLLLGLFTIRQWL